MFKYTYKEISLEIIENAISPKAAYDLLISLGQTKIANKIKREFLDK